MPQKHVMLKIAVIGMGVALVIGSGVVVVTITHRLGQPTARIAFDIPLPPNSEVLESHESQGRLMLRLRRPDGEEIRLFDTASGREIGLIHLKPQP